MFLCGSCHGKTCRVEHCMVTFGPCEECGRETECWDCVASFPVRKEEIEKARSADFALRKSQGEIYRSVTQVEYPSRKRKDHDPR